MAGAVVVGEAAAVVVEVPLEFAGRRVTVILLDEEEDDVVVDVATAGVEFERLSKRIA